jgi:predicted Zn-dependent protease
MSRREKIEAMLADDPHDTFLRYSLAMELRNAGEHEQSLQRLAELREEDPPYVPAYFMAAQQLADLDRGDEARSLLAEGIKQAEAQGDAHAAAEMSDFLLALGDGGL